MNPVAVLAMVAGRAAWGAWRAALPAISEHVVSGLCSAVWQGALLAACVAVGLRLMPRLSAAARSAVWLNVFALVTALHVVPLLMRGTAAGGAARHAAIELDPRWSVAVAAVWAALTAWKLTELAMSAVSLRRIARRATAVDAGETVRALLDGAGGRRAKLCTSREVERPCVIGSFSTRFSGPRVVIPEALLGELSEVELGQVLLHEMEHVRRWDDWCNLAQKIGVALFPLNPALAWVERRLCTERELACDDRVLRASAERKTYALCLARVAEFSLVNRGLALALGAWGRRPELVKRVQRILRRPAEAHAGRIAVLAPAAVTLAALGCAAVLARSPQVVSFAPAHAVTAARVETQAGAAHMVETSARMNMTQRMSTQGAKVVLLKAVMPRRPATARARAMTPGAQMVRARMQQKTRQQFVVMTRWEQMEMPQMVITVEQMNRPDRTKDEAPSLPVSTPRYAAVPFGNGWLIVQL